MKQKILFITLALLCIFSFAIAEEMISPVIAPDPLIELQPEMSVKINSDRKPIMHTGETIHLTSTLIGFDWCSGIQYQWECDKNDEFGFQPIFGATLDHYEFPATAETLTWSWRLVVHYN